MPSRRADSHDHNSQDGALLPNYACPSVDRPPRGADENDTMRSRVCLGWGRGGGSGESSQPAAIGMFAKTFSDKLHNKIKATLK